MSALLTLALAATTAAGAAAVKAVPDKDTPAGKDICSLPPAAGPCRAAKRRWHFDAAAGKCKRFIYGGCKGNANNFNTVEECAQACGPNKTPPPPPPFDKEDCLLPALPPDLTIQCLAALPRWTYNADTGKCDAFTYGGCGGTPNIFKSEAECLAACEGVTRPDEKDVCELDIDPGPCKAAFKRYGFNGGECVEFTYGGCQGNGNNFESLEECEKACEPSKPDVCSLKIDPGPCKASFKRYGFNGGECVEFIYGGCKGNGNNFESLEECEKACESSEPDVCELPKDPGPCKALKPRYYFNGSECEKFNYGGCQGNANNFETLEACEAKCEPKDVCELPKDPGPCKALVRRYYFNGGECVQFNYGGCQGNANNFESLEECEAKCDPPAPPPKDICKLPKVVGPCEAAIPRWYFNGEQCEQLTFGGCEGNENNFETLEECEKACDEDDPDVCSLEMDPGPCDGAFKRYAFNGGECVEFVYGGCKGNKNNFESLEACEKACEPPPPPPPKDICELPKVVGPCEAAIPRWYFNGDKCEEFTFGGCQGNANNFETLEECEKTCDDADPDVCSLDIVPGPCRGSFKRYGFNGGECVEFIYGGCKGNGNNFESLEECEKACEPAKPDVCSLPAVTGPCRARFRRWYFNGKECELFTYGGCRGNENNFETKEECAAACDARGE